MKKKKKKKVKCTFPTFREQWHKSIPVKSVHWGQAEALSEAGMGISKVHHLIKAWVTGQRASRC